MKINRCFLPLAYCVIGLLWFAADDAIAQTATATLGSDPTSLATEPNSKRPGSANRKNPRSGVAKTFEVHPGWNADRFPDHAMCYQTPDQIAATLLGSGKTDMPPVTSLTKPTDGSLRIVATGHSFMTPGFSTLPAIAKAAGFEQQGLLTHVGGGMTGSARYKWEQENGIFQFDRKPTPKLLSSIAGAKWDAMMWGPYYNDRPEYYSCWIDFCLKYNPDMKFYMADAWPQLEQLSPTPRREEELTTEVVTKMHQEKRDNYRSIIDQLNKRYNDRVFVLPTSLAMVLAVEAFHRGELPGVEGVHSVLGGKERSLWRDRLGHLGRGMEKLEGYVFYATLYGRSPELMNTTAESAHSTDTYPSPALDKVFRKIAWQAAVGDPLSGIVDKDDDGISDNR
ncbi:hypothetical protein [Rubripirellula reticaptiva]|uniref:Uncharacterized protein n=1 Tax=Rubripirellula reticaptiva TaxID=2528013 RepID=A0A5C6EHC0_9BACT|nr:hypothetical protein [Rubripirellula reticaptiva]TWU46649.1 hypothetical protein Poly59_56220 [Rubripirellula reticaptiva]